jgi:hypothetical protein
MVELRAELTEAQRLSGRNPAPRQAAPGNRGESAPLRTAPWEEEDWN